MSKHLHGIDVLGSAEIVFGTLEHFRGEFDNLLTYNPGETVSCNGRNYQALRQVTPPFIPTLQAGDVPGQSDAWREVVDKATPIGVEHVVGGPPDNFRGDFSSDKYYNAGDSVAYSGAYYVATVASNMSAPYDGNPNWTKSPNRFATIAVMGGIWDSVKNFFSPSSESYTVKEQGDAGHTGTSADKASTPDVARADGRLDAPVKPKTPTVPVSPPAAPQATSFPWALAVGLGGGAIVLGGGGYLVYRAVKK